MAVDAEAAGMDAFMDKPFRLEELTAVYVKLLERDNRNQRVVSTYQMKESLGKDSSLGAVISADRLIRNITPNAKIFVDSHEFDDVVASQIVGDASSLAGTSPIIAVAVAASECNEKRMSGTVLPPSRSGSGIYPNSSKVHAAN